MFIHDPEKRFTHFALSLKRCDWQARFYAGARGAQAPSLWLGSQIFEGFPFFVTDKDLNWLETINAVHSDMNFFCGIGDMRRPRGQAP